MPACLPLLSPPGAGPPARYCDPEAVRGGASELTDPVIDKLPDCLFMKAQTAGTISKPICAIRHTVFGIPRRSDIGWTETRAVASPSGAIQRLKKLGKLFRASARRITGNYKQQLGITGRPHCIVVKRSVPREAGVWSRKKTAKNAEYRVVSAADGFCL